MKISLHINNQEETKAFEWPCVPRVGEYVAPIGAERYKVLEVVHMFRRGADSPEGEIVLHVADAPE